MRSIQRGVRAQTKGPGFDRSPVVSLASGGRRVRRPCVLASLRPCYALFRFAATLTLGDRFRAFFRSIAGWKRYSGSWIGVTFSSGSGCR